jgi:hypothetical protein
MKEFMDNHQDIINLIKSTPAIQPPDDLTPRVMARLPVLDRGIWSQVRQSLLNPSWAGVQSRWAQILPVSNKRECSFCFFITGFFYLIMGIVLMAGFKAIGSSMAAMEWITLQPHLTIGAAMWLLSLGMVLMTDGRTAIKMTRYGTLFYVFFAVVNGILMRPYLHVPYAGVFIIGFVATSALMGVMLALAVKKVELRPV